MTAPRPSAAVPVLDAAAIAALVPRLDALALMRELFASLGRGRAVQPPQTLTLFPDGRGDYITYLGADADLGLFGAKLSPYLERPQGPLVTAWTLLMSMADGRPRLLCDAGQLTTERTAATTALAVDLLAPRTAARLAVIGAGPVGEAHLRHALALRPWQSVAVASRRLAADAARVAVLEAIDPRVRVAGGVDEAVRAADVVLLCTSSGTQVLDPRRLERPALVSSVSGNVANAHEVPPEALPAMDVYCDDARTSPAKAGEMVLAARAGLWSAERLAGDLAGLVLGTAPRPDGRRPVFFRSVGLGLEDIAMAAAIARLVELSPTAAGPAAA